MQTCGLILFFENISYMPISLLVLEGFLRDWLVFRGSILPIYIWLGRKLGSDGRCSFSRGQPETSQRALPKLQVKYNHSPSRWMSIPVLSAAPSLCRVPNMPCLQILTFKAPSLFILVFLRGTASPFISLLDERL